MLFREVALTQRIGIAVVVRPVRVSQARALLFRVSSLLTQISSSSREEAPSWALGFVSCFGGRVVKPCVASVPLVVHFLQCKILNVYSKQLRSTFFFSL